MEEASQIRVGWQFDGTTYTGLPRPFYRFVEPTPVAGPRLALLNDGLARELGLDPDALRQADGVAVLAGNRRPPGAAPLAMAYAGHQFGGFTMLGDGRAVLLGEHVTPAGRRVDIQLKGAGPTPYSRGGDGRGVLGPMLREYVISEAMHGLGISTTRSLAVVETGERVFRHKPLPGAVLTRVAQSHLRVGTFQFAAAWHGPKAVRALADYALRRHFPEAAEGKIRDGAERGPMDHGRYVYLLEEVIRRQARLVAQWQLVGFVHGVMNTDNMTISGETIDYGPCAFIDAYDPDAVFSSIDNRGRYAYGKQPPIAQWNLARFADTLLPLLHTDEEVARTRAQDALDQFRPQFEDHWLTGMRAKLGLAGRQPEDKALVDDVLALMHRQGADYTNTFRALTLDDPERAGDGLEGTDHGVGPLFASTEWKQWRSRWLRRLRSHPSDKATGRLENDGGGGQTTVRADMRRANPAIIPRNHRVEDALTAAEAGDLGPVKRLLQVLMDPYAYSPAQRAWASPPPPSAPAYVTYCGT